MTKWGQLDTLTMVPASAVQVAAAAASGLQECSLEVLWQCYVGLLVNVWILQAEHGM